MHYYYFLVSGCVHEFFSGTSLLAGLLFLSKSSSNASKVAQFTPLFDLLKLF